MFDTYNLKGGGSHSHYHRVSINEKRAPTDESVKLLAEMQDKAQKSVIAAYRVKTNGFTCDVIACEDMLGNCYTLVTKYSLNDHEHEVTTYIDKFDLNRSGGKIEESKFIWDAVKSDVVKSISENILIKPAILAIDEISDGRGRRQYKE